MLKKGTILRASEFGLLATIGCTQNVKVYTNLVTVGVLSTGNELVSAGIERLPTGKIRDSNKVMLMTILREVIGKLNMHESVEVLDLGIIKDDGVAIDSAIKAAIKDQKCNIIVTSGGVSMGEMDLIKPYIEQAGKVLFGRLNMKPGKPTTIGVIQDTLLFGLPGNPVSSFVTANLLFPVALLSLLDRRYSFAQKIEWPIYVDAQMYPQTVKADMVRPEYHRCVVY